MLRHDRAVMHGSIALSSDRALGGLGLGNLSSCAWLFKQLDTPLGIPQ